MPTLKLTLSQKIQLYACAVSFIFLLLGEIECISYGLNRYSENLFVILTIALVCVTLSLIAMIFSFYQIMQINEKITQKPRIELLLHHALLNNEFILHYQPIIAAKSKIIKGAEALIRWNSPELGMVSPLEFIPIAERTGLIVPLSHWVLKTACEQQRKWHDLGYEFLKIAVNLSAYQFRTGGLVESIANILTQTQGMPHRLDLEITESMLMENPQRCALVLKVLKSMGITLSVDDFGTGYSSLSYLRRFPIDAIKIDKSFISSVCSSPEDASIVKAIITMARDLRIKTIAEGVETYEQAKYLTEQGLDELQGYYFSPPLTASDFTSLLKQPSQIQAL